MVSPKRNHHRPEKASDEAGPPEVGPLMQRIDIAWRGSAGGGEAGPP
jgi:hypothetical protein